MLVKKMVPEDERVILIRLFILYAPILGIFASFNSMAIAQNIKDDQGLVLPHLLPPLAPVSSPKSPPKSRFQQKLSREERIELLTPCCLDEDQPIATENSSKTDIEEVSEDKTLETGGSSNTDIEEISEDKTLETEVSNTTDIEQLSEDKPLEAEVSRNVPAMNMFLGQPTAKHLSAGDVILSFTNRFFSESGSGVGEETSAYPNLGFSWGITDDLELSFEGQIVDSGGPGRQGPFRATRKSQANTDFALEVKQRLWQYYDQTLSWSGVFSISAGERGFRFFREGETFRGEGGRVTPALQFPFTAILDNWELTLSPSVAFFNQGNAIHLHRAPIENPGSFGTTFGLAGGVSYSINPRLTIWGDAFVPATGNNSINRDSGRTAKAIAYNGGLRYKVNPRLSVDVFGSNALGSVGPLSLTADRELTAFGTKVTFMPNWFEGNLRYPDSYSGDFGIDSPVTEDGLNFFDGGTVPMNRFLLDLKGGSQGFLSAFRYGLFKDLELGVFLDYIRGRVDESEQGLSAKLRLLNQEQGDPVTGSLGITVGMTNEPFINFFTDNSNEFFERGLPKSVPWIADEDSLETGKLLIATVSIPLHYKFEQGLALWFTPTIGYVQRSANDIELAGFNVGTSVPVIGDWSLVGEVGANLTENGNGFRGAFRRDSIPWTFAVRWNPANFLGYSIDDQLGYPYLDLYITNRVGFSSWQQLRVRNQNRTAVGVGLRFPF